MHNTHLVIQHVQRSLFLHRLMIKCGVQDGPKSMETFVFLAIEKPFEGFA